MALKYFLVIVTYSVDCAFRWVDHDMHYHLSRNHFAILFIESLCSHSKKLEVGLKEHQFDLELALC